MLLITEQPLNVCVGSDVRAVLIETDVNDVHPLKHRLPMDVSVFGITKEVNAVAPQKIP